MLKCNRGIFVLIVVNCIALFGCRTKDKEPATGNLEDMFLDYQVAAREGDSLLTVLLHFRKGEGDDAVAIPNNGRVSLDGVTINPDSTNMGAIFYETNQSIDQFEGDHEIRLQTSPDMSLTEKFNFKPVTLRSVIPDTIDRSEFVIELDGLGAEERIRVVMTDTSFVSNGVNRLELVQDGKMILSAEDFIELASGPVQMEIIREFEQPVKNDTGGGGILRLIYSLTREFVLKD